MRHVLRKLVAKTHNPTSLRSSRHFFAECERRGLRKALGSTEKASEAYLLHHSSHGRTLARIGPGTNHPIRIGHQVGDGNLLVRRVPVAQQVAEGHFGGCDAGWV